jgi:hypothetical protein
MVSALKSAAVILLVAAPAFALAQSPAAPSVEKAVEQAYMLFCMPLVAKGATNTDEVAGWSNYKKTTLPNFAGLRVRSAPAWLVPSASGRVVVSRGSIDERVPLSCEIIVSGSPSEPLQKKIAEATMCKGCPFVHNRQVSREQNGIRFDKYDWRMPEKNALVSVMTYALPASSQEASFLVHIHKVP